MATVTYSQSGLYLHIVLKEVGKKKENTPLSIFVHDIGSIPTEIAGLGVCGTVTTGSHLFYSNISYSLFGLLCCVTRGALVPRKKAYTAWRNKNKSNGHRNKLCPLFRFPVCTQCGGMLQYRELKIKSVLFKLVECGWMNKAESYCEGTGNQERQRSVLLKDNRCFVRCHRDLRIK